MCVEAKESSLAAFVPPIFQVHGKERKSVIYTLCKNLSSMDGLPTIHSLHAYGPPPTRWQIFITFVSVYCLQFNVRLGPESPLDER
jgi:hypothetical protein